MSLKEQLVKTALSALHYSQITKIMRPFTQGQGVIFCLHRVEPTERLPVNFTPNNNLSSTPEALENAIIHFRNRGFDFIGMNDVAARLQSGSKSKKPFVVFTLDDGYKDNAEFALPVFKKHIVPFTIYIAPNLVEGTTEMWWLALEQIIREQQNVELSLGGTTLQLLPNNKQEVWKTLQRIIQEIDEHEQRQWIRDQAERFNIDLKKYCSDLIMTWDEIRALAAEPLATIGAHTLNHFAVKKLSAEQANFEITESGRIVSQKIAKPVRHFAYPYGNVAHAGPRDFVFAKAANYETAVTTRMGTVDFEHAQHLHALPRVIFSGTYNKPEWLDVLASGFPSRIKNRGRKLNVS